MRSFFVKVYAGVIWLLIWGSCFGQLCVYAAGKDTVTADRILDVDISRNDGVKVTPGDKEIISTNVRLNYQMDTGVEQDLFKYRLNENEKNAGADAQIDCKVLCQYSLSTGKGSEPEEWKDTAGGAFTLIPGAIADGSYCIRFRKLQEYVLKPEESEPEQVSENSVSENKAAKAKRAEYEKNRKAAEKLIDAEPVHEVLSARYYVLLDSVQPSIDLYSEGEFDTWTNGNIKCRVKVNDTGSKPATLKVSCAGTQIAEETYQSGSNLTGFEKEFVISAETADDNGNELLIEASDAAGNVNVIRKTVKIDKTAPSIDLTGAENGGTYGKAVNISVTGEDAHINTVCVGYTIKRTYEGTEEVIGSSAGTLAELKEKVLFLADRDGDYSVECKAVDGAGNTSAPVKCMFRVDMTAPGIDLTGVAQGGITREDAALTIGAYDNFADAYKVKVSGTVSSRNGTNDIRLAQYRTEGSYSKNTYYFKADGEYDITVSVTDQAGNTCDDSISFTIDKTVPVIDISGGASIKDATVTNTPPTISFRIKEYNYETAEVSCVLKNKGKTSGNGVCQSPEWIMDSEVSEFSLTIEEEGEYELEVRVRDAAGNSAVKTVRFTLDMTKPEIDYIENLNKKYVKSFKLPDNFGEYIRDDGGVDYKAYINSMNYDESQEISEDGRYILKVSAVDDAGNQAEKSVEFIVDGTMPRVVIDGMADDGSVNKDDILLLSLYDEDDFFTSVRFNGEEMVTQEKQRDVELKIPDFGDYTIEIEASDMADNILTQTIEAKCANAAPVVKGASTIRTLKQNTKSGSNKGLRIFLIIMTVAVLAAAVVVYYLYSVRTADRAMEN